MTDRQACPYAVKREYVYTIMDSSVRETPDDYSMTPIKLARIENAPLISKNIASDIKKLLAIAKVLKL